MDLYDRSNACNGYDRTAKTHNLYPGRQKLYSGQTVGSVSGFVVVRRSQQLKMLLKKVLKDYIYITVLTKNPSLQEGSDGSISRWPLIYRLLQIRILCVLPGHTTHLELSSSSRWTKESLSYHLAY